MNAYPSAPPPPPQGYYQGPPVMAPLPGYYQGPPVMAPPPPRREPSFFEGCLAVLRCCFLLDECCGDPSI
ncbi:hypothetical protein K1719_034952 [Acacia pycnantha]|nr:hypothetical protein K1719_034952 [Acacia pycnantha]